MYGPDPTAAVENGILNKAWGTVATMAPVKTFAGTPPAEYQPTDTNLFAAQFNGINSMVYAYSGAVMFVAFLSEMRRPMDFWKGLLVAQTFISVVYIFFGAFVSATNAHTQTNDRKLNCHPDLPLLRPVWLQQRQPIRPS
jgi:hypothetical protein